MKGLAPKLVGQQNDKDLPMARANPVPSYRSQENINMERVVNLYICFECIAVKAVYLL